MLIINPVNRSGNGTADHTIEPVVIRSRRAEFPFIDSSVVRYGSDTVICRQTGKCHRHLTLNNAISNRLVLALLVRSCRQ
ncbi:MAG: hypothetical protein LBU65_04835 [Planctomycetaceae bacterium]|nr:hypothetical protein [Planctomycetaceae bacterium]